MTFTGGSLTVGGCVINGLTGLTVVGNTVTGSGAVTFSGTCTGPGGGNVSVAVISPASQTYVLGSSPAPSVTVTSSDAGVNCALSGSDGSRSTANAGGTITFAAPTAVSTVTYTVACTSSTNGVTSVTPSPASVSVSATSGGGGGGDPSCSATQQSSVFGGRTLSRQCSGSASFGTYHPAYSGPLTDLAAVAGDSKHPGPFPNFISGYTMRMPINSGSYVSLKFVATNPGQMQFNTDPSFGDGGWISVSTKPGAFTVADGVISGIYGACVYNYGFSNSLWMGMNGADCALTRGATYYVNFADVDSNGVAQCFNGSPGNCANSPVSYQILSSQ